MKKVNFSRDFYEKVAAAIEKYRESIDPFEPDETYYVNDEADGYSFEVGVQYGSEWHDDSFDHAFGTWHDPYPYYEPTNIDWIGEVTVWDGDGKQVDGFSEEDFWAQFEVAERNGHKAGDKVTAKFGGKLEECEFLAYNRENGMYKLCLNGEIKHTDRLFKAA